MVFREAVEEQRRGRPMHTLTVLPTRTPFQLEAWCCVKAKALHIPLRHRRVDCVSHKLIGTRNLDRWLQNIGRLSPGGKVAKEVHKIWWRTRVAMIAHMLQNRVDTGYLRISMVIMKPQLCDSVQAASLFKVLGLWTSYDNMVWLEASMTPSGRSSCNSSTFSLRHQAYNAFEIPSRFGGASIAHTQQNRVDNSCLRYIWIYMVIKHSPSSATPFKPSGLWSLYNNMAWLEANMTIREFSVQPLHFLLGAPSSWSLCRVAF